VVLNRHLDTCSLNPEVQKEGFFSFLWPFSVIPYLLARFLGFQFKSARLGNPKAATHNDVDLQCLSL